MSQAEELLQGLSAGAATIADDVNYVSIENRHLIVPAHLQRLGVSADHGVNTVHFVGPRYSENGTDLSKMNIWVNYRRSEDEYEDKALCTNVKVDSKDDSLLHYDWLITRNVTEVFGNVTVIVCAKDVDGAGNEDEHWNTELYTEFYVSEGMEVDGDCIINQQPDLVDSMLDRINTVENKTTSASILGYVDRYLDENPSVITEHIEDIVADQPIQEFVEGYLDDYVDIGTTDERTLEGSVAGAYEMVGMEGASEQKTLEGKNLFNKATSTDGYGISNSNGNPYIDANASVSDFIEVEPSTKYAVNGILWANLYTENKTHIGMAPAGSIITTPSNAKYIRLSFSTTAKNIVQFEKGDKVTPYEPYCGGKASPNPDYPQEIKSVGPEVTVKTVGKNFLGGLAFANILPYDTIDKVAKTVKVSATNLSNSFLYTNFKENTQYTFVLKGYNSAYEANGVIHTNMAILYTDGTKKELRFDSNGNVYYVSTAGKTIEKFYGVAYGYFTIFDYEDCGVFEGVVTVDDFEPYQESSAKITLPEPLRGIGDVRDMLMKRAGKWGVLRNIARVVLDGTESGWYLTKDATTNVIRFTITLENGKAGLQTSICSHFTNKDGAWANYEYGIYSDFNSSALKFFRQPNENVTTLTQWKPWLAENLPTLQYVLATPTWEELDEAAQIALDNMVTYDGVTYISVYSKVQPVVTSKYGTSEVGARALTNTNRIEEHEEECDQRFDLLEIQTGDQYEIRGCKAGGLRLTEMTGKTEQKTMSGKNLFDINGNVNTRGNDGSVNTCNTVSNGILTSNTTTSGHSYGQVIGGLAGKTVTFSAKIVALGGNGAQIGIYENNTIVIHEPGSTVGETLTVTHTFTSDEGCFAFTGVSGTGAQFTDIQVELGTTATDYEPYCGGTPSPNPSFPQAIENTFDCVEMMQGIYSTTNGVYTSDSSCVCTKNSIPCKSGDKIKISLDTKSHYRVVFYNDNSFVSASISSEMPTIYETTVPSGANRFTFYLSQSGVTLTPQTVGKITLTVNGKYVGQIVEHGKNLFDISKSTNLTKISDDEIRMNAIDTTIYEHYFKENTQYTFSAYVKNALNDGSTSLGNLRIRIRYTDGSYDDALMNNTTEYKYLTFTSDAGKTISRVTGYFGNGGYLYLKDFQIEEGTVATLYEPYTEKVTTFFLNEPLRATDRLFKDGDGLFKVEHGMKEVVLNGTESGWHFENNANASTIFIFLNDCDYTGEIMCSHFTQCASNGVAVADRVNHFILYSNKAFQIYLPSGTFTDLASGKEWLANNPTTVQYTLVEPTIEVLDTESQLALNSLETFKDMTYIEVDSKIPPTSISGEYGTSQVGAYTLKALLNSESSLVNDAANKARIEELAVAIVATGSEE